MRGIMAHPTLMSPSCRMVGVHAGSRSDARTARYLHNSFGGRNMKTMTRMAMMVAVMVLAVTSVGQAQGGGGRGQNRLDAVLKDSLKVSDAILQPSGCQYS